MGRRAENPVWGGDKASNWVVVEEDAKHVVVAQIDETPKMGRRRFLGLLTGAGIAGGLWLVDEATNGAVGSLVKQTVVGMARGSGSEGGALKKIVVVAPNGDVPVEASEVSGLVVEKVGDYSVGELKIVNEMRVSSLRVVASADVSVSNNSSNGSDSERRSLQGQEWDKPGEEALSYVLKNRPFVAPIEGDYTWRVNYVNKYGVHGNRQYEPRRYPWFGEDFGGGMSVVAMFPGIVKATAEVHTDAGYVGHYMDVASNAGLWLARYVHIDPLVQVGDSVIAGQRIAVKSTDMSSLFPHLHLGLVHGSGPSDWVIVPAKEAVTPPPSSSYDWGADMASVRAGYFDYIAKLRGK